MTDRRSFIGGSDAAAAAGLDDSKTPLALWMEKTGQLEPEDIGDVERVIWGNALEPAVLGEFARRNGAEDIRPQVRLADAKYPWAGGTADAVARINGETCLVEVKTAGRDRMHLWGEAGDAVPMRYLMQVHHYLTLAGLRVAYIPVLIGGNEYREYRIEADPEISTLLMAKEGELWQCVQTMTPPELTNNPKLLERDARLRWAVDKGQSVEATDTAVNVHRELMDVRFRIKELEEREGMLKAILMSQMGEASSLTRDGKILATWREVKSQRTDIRAMREDAPELVAKHTIKTSCRTFLPKKI